MTEIEVERVLNLQKSAYELLLWIDKRAQHEQELLSDENLAKWRFAESCETWVRAIHGMIPPAFRPESADIPAFARLYSSFFLTSFRLVESAPVRAYDYYGHESGFTAGGKRRLMAGAPGEKKSTKGKAKAGVSARELRLIALEELALENDVLLSRPQLEQLGNERDLHEAVTLWTYFHELNRRANFVSQGDAVRSLWQAMDKHQRERMTTEKILQARTALLKAIKGLN